MSAKPNYAELKQRIHELMEKMYKEQMPLVGKKCYQAYKGLNSICPWCPKPGEGTSFKIYFPARAAESEKQELETPY